MFVGKVSDFLKESIFPIYCLGCNKEGEWACESCFKKIPLNGVFCCPVCHQNNGTGNACRNCQSASSLDRTIAIAPYEESGLLGKIIENFKYNYVEELENLISKIIKNFLVAKSTFRAEAVVPVPLHQRRLAERGFNQAGIIAEIAAKELNLPLNLILKRSHHTKQQAKLNRESRKINVVGAFKAGKKLAGTVLLVDDVFTTGSTMQECARVLKEQGVKKVIGFSLARG